MGAAARLALAAVLGLAGFAPQARARSASPPVIITVDVQQILRDSLVAKDVQAQMGRRTERYTREVTAEENALQKTQDKLERERSSLPTGVFDARMRDFQRRYDALDNRVQATRQALQQSYNNAMTKVENTALQIISNIAAERKANLVLTKTAVLFEAPDLDITQEVIKRLDATLPKIKLAAPKSPAASGAATRPVPHAAPRSPSNPPH